MPSASYTITFDFDEMNLVFQALGKLPAERSFMLIQRLGAEVAEANKTAAIIPPAPPKAEVPDVDSGSLQ
jgi:hypothetical protein